MTANGTVKHQASIYFVKENDHGGFEFYGQTVDTGEAVILKVNTKGYDSEARKWIDDEEVMAKAMERLAPFGVTDLTDAIDTLNALAMADSLIFDEVYVDGGRAQFTPIQDFGGNFGPRTEWTKLDAALNKKLKAYKDEELETLPIEEFNGYRFNMGVHVPELDVNVRVSQIVFADEDGDVDDEEPAISLKYSTKAIDGLRDDLKEGKIQDAQVERVKGTIRKLADISRAQKVEELTQLFGRSFEDMIKNKDVIKGRIVTQKFGGSNFYAQLLVKKDDIVIVDGEATTNEE